MTLQLKTMTFFAAIKTIVSGAYEKEEKNRFMI